MGKSDIEILHTITSAVHQSFDLDYIYETALDLTLTLKDVDIAFIYIVSNDRKEAVLEAHRNLTEDYLNKATRIPYPKGITWKLINSGQVINVDDIQKDNTVGPAGKKLGHRRGLGIPIKLEGIVMGAIWLTSFKKGKFSKDEEKLIHSVGNSIAIAIAKAKLYKEMEEQVKIRTSELEETNKRLQQEIEDHKQAVDELREIRKEHQLVNAINNILENIQTVDQSPKEDEVETISIDETPPHEALTNREYRIMVKIASGKKIKDIATDHYLSASTVSTYRARILDKLKLNSNSELIRYAVKHNLID